ncbi:hypothetical protein GLA29479_2808 [Lysobacter antibioticus]|nr:hypothetical protein GLA29479_2808 [Lysobacter antibioticus]
MALSFELGPRRLAFETGAVIAFGRYGHERVATGLMMPVGRRGDRCLTAPPHRTPRRRRWKSTAPT